NCIGLIQFQRKEKSKMASTVGWPFCDEEGDYIIPPRPPLSATQNPVIPPIRYQRLVSSFGTASPDSTTTTTTDTESAVPTTRKIIKLTGGTGNQSKIRRAPTTVSADLDVSLSDIISRNHNRGI